MCNRETKDCDCVVRYTLSKSLFSGGKRGGGGSGSRRQCRQVLRPYSKSVTHNLNRQTILRHNNTDLTLTVATAAAAVARYVKGFPEQTPFGKRQVYTTYENHLDLSNPLAQEGDTETFILRAEYRRYVIRETISVISLITKTRSFSKSNQIAPLSTFWPVVGFSGEERIYSTVLEEKRRAEKREYPGM